MRTLGKTGLGPVAYIGGFGFSIPAVAGVVSHLVVHVLSETQLVFGDADFDKVEVDPPDEVPQDGVVDHPLNDTTRSSIRFRE